MTYAEALRFLLDLLDGTRYPRPPGREANLIRVGRLLSRLRPPRGDRAVLEVGLGGRLDATNICAPLLSVITPISYDHMEVLGRTLGAIAQEKVGIIRAGRPLVIAPQAPEAEEALRLACARVGASLVRVAGRARWDSRAMNAQGQTLHLRGARDYGAIHLPLVGRHQALNAATAVVAAEELAAAGFPLPPEAVRQGLEGLRWPGRV